MGCVIELEVIDQSGELEVKPDSIEWGLDEYIPTKSVDAPVYDGATVFIPSQSEQTVMTSGYLLDENIIIQPIPSNYGLITWDGSVLTVS